MKCEQVVQLLGGFCEGSLEENSAREVTAHLADCRRCREEKRAIERTLNALSMFERIEPSEDFSARLWQRIDEFEASRRVLVLTAVAAFLRRNRRVLVTSCLVFTISLVSSIFVLRQRVASPDVRVAERAAVTEGFVIREIPQTVAVTQDTVQMDFAIGERPAQTVRRSENYAFTPVVQPVSDVEPAF
jgi:anti-sigma factor RsiW